MFSSCPSDTASPVTWHIIELKRITYFSFLHYYENRWRKLPSERYFDKHAVSRHRNDKIINWYRVRWWFFAQREGLSETHRWKRLICCLQVGEMKINARDDDSWLFGVALLFKQKRKALPLPPGEVSFLSLNGSVMMTPLAVVIMTIWGMTCNYQCFPLIYSTWDLIDFTTQEAN